MGEYHGVQFKHMASRSNKTFFDLSKLLSLRSRWATTRIGVDDNSSLNLACFFRWINNARTNNLLIQVMH